jgi:hypothetical protein
VALGGRLWTQHRCERKKAQTKNILSLDECGGLVVYMNGKDSKQPISA